MSDKVAKFSVTDLDLFYGDFQALKKINMDIKANEISAFIGPSGCGKSTFLKTLNRMNDLVESVKIDGQILLDGVNIYSDIDVIKLRSRVGMVFQQPNPFPMSIYDNVAYGPRIHGIKKKSQLVSGGQQQRICIARTLAVEPEVILMDEPTSALDPISTLKIEDLAVELKKDYTIIIVTHNMQQASRISDKTAFFLLGEMIEYGNTEQIFNNPIDQKTEDYITGRFG